LEQLAGADAFDVLGVLENDLLADVLRGRLVPGLGGVRKARLANPRRGKGKRGGYRYFYLYVEHRGHIHFLLLLDKNEQEDLTPAERLAVMRIVAEIKAQ
jgi:hypothetical protein